MHALHKKPLLRKSVAGGFLILGVAGLVLPIIPGIVFLGLALYLLSIDAPRIQRWIVHYRERHSALDTALKHTYDQLHVRYGTETKEARKEVL